MRTRTNFVVEYKSHRRLTKAQPSSIWGNLDLQAVARQVEADGGLPADALVRRPEEGYQPASPITALEPKSENTELSAASDAAPPQSKSEPVAMENRRPLDGPLATQQTTEKAAREAPSKNSQPRKVKNEPRRKAQSEPAAMPQEAFADELTALEAENLQLKRRMMARLREENILLNSMLGRFLQS